MVGVLAENAQVTLPLQQRLLPTLISILQAPPDKVPPGLPAVSMFFFFFPHLKCYAQQKFGKYRILT